MKKIIISFWLGVDVLGFPNIHNHELRFKPESKFFKSYSK